MRRGTKISLGVVGLVVIGAIIAAVVSYELTQGAPSWYHPHSLTQEERAAAARSADNKFLSLVSKAADAQAAARRAGRTTNPSNSALDDSAGSTTVTFSSDELNAFFYKWIQLNNWKHELDRYLADPQIILKDGQIILAGKASLGGLFDQTIVSIHFSPKLTSDGQLELTIDGLWAGRLPLPDSVWDAQRAKLVALIHKSLPSLRQGARIDSSGSADADAVATVMSKDLLNILQGQAVPPVIFLPVDQHHGYPMKLTKLQIEDKQITLGAKPLDPGDLTKLQERIKKRD